MKRLILLVSVAALSACSQAGEESSGDAVQAQPAAAPAAGPSRPTHAHADFAGDWFGPEGLFVNVELSAPGQYMLTMAGNLDAPKDGEEFQGRDAMDGISFVRDNEPLLLKRAAGKDTGLKYLDGEKDCLMVQEGEGFCRR